MERTSVLFIVANNFPYIAFGVMVAIYFIQRRLDRKARRYEDRLTDRKERETWPNS